MKLSIFNKQVMMLKLKLAHTDYKAIKFAEGVLTEEEYAPIKEKRAQWRKEINDLISNKEEK